MKYWDSSALITLVVAQKDSRTAQGIVREDPGIVSWGLSDIEVASALCRLGREGSLDSRSLAEALSRVEALWASVHAVSHVEAVKSRARRVLRLHPLRSADALQLGAALAAAADQPSGWGFVSLDARLREAACREGFEVLPSAV